MENIILTVSVVDKAYKTPKLEIVYAGGNIIKAERIYSDYVARSDRTDVYLDLVQGKVNRRLREVVA